MQPSHVDQFSKQLRNEGVPSSLPTESQLILVVTSRNKMEQHERFVLGFIYSPNFSGSAHMNVSIPSSA